jgi:uncharacterized protein (DUF1778 family)
MGDSTEKFGLNHKEPTVNISFTDAGMIEKANHSQYLGRVSTSASRAPHNATTHAVNLRVRSETRTLIDRAAQAQGKTRSEFMIDAARRAAEDALLDQTFLRVDQNTYDCFLNALDQPPSGEGFERLMNARKPWAS